MDKKNLTITVTLLMFFHAISSCQNIKNTFQNKQSKKYTNLVEGFESELNQLDMENYKSIDSATIIFNKYRVKTNDIQQIDSLFQPYFNVYNIGRSLLINEKDSIIEKYGFNKLIYNERVYIIPQNCEYLSSNILSYLSKPMKEFTTQQLTEFGAKTTQQKGEYTIWWENFNNSYPKFFLNEMAEYHYKFWHLKNLIYSSFHKNGELKKDIIVEYDRLIKKYPKSKTAQTLVEYLQLINNCNGKKNLKINDYWKQYKQE